MSASPPRRREGRVYVGRERTTENQSCWPRCQLRSEPPARDARPRSAAGGAHSGGGGEVSAVLVRISEPPGRGGEDDLRKSERQSAKRQSHRVSEEQQEWQAAKNVRI